VEKALGAAPSLFEQYKTEQSFYIVYILEAHASDAWQMALNIRQNVVLNSPRTFKERISVADACVRNLHIPIPALIDNFANTGNRLYRMAGPPICRGQERPDRLQKRAWLFRLRACRHGKSAQACEVKNAPEVGRFSDVLMLEGYY
jgi:hypothetical protein